MSAKTSKKPSPRKRHDGLRAEYRFDYATSRPNRFAGGARGDTIAVVLDPDVATVFNSSESVNALLRTVISVLPKPPKSPRKTVRAHS